MSATPLPDERMPGRGGGTRSRGASPRGSTAGPLTRAQQTTYNDIVNNANRMAHIFRPKHNLANMVFGHGSREAVVRAVVMNLGRVPTTQPFSVLRIVNGSVLRITGRVVNGTTRIGDFWRPMG